MKVKKTAKPILCSSVQDDQNKTKRRQRDEPGLYKYEPPEEYNILGFKFKLKSRGRWIRPAKRI